MTPGPPCAHGYQDDQRDSCLDCLEFEREKLATISDIRAYVESMPIIESEKALVMTAAGILVSRRFVAISDRNRLVAACTYALKQGTFKELTK